MIFDKFSADNQIMVNQSLIHVILEVLKDPRVIVTAIICFVAMDLACYIVRYRKKTKVRRHKIVSAAPAASTANANAASTDASASGSPSEEATSSASHASK